MTPDYPSSTAVICHDAGAANVIIAALKHSGRTDWRACMQGPAYRLWIESFPEIPVYETPEEALEGVELLISGTGWASDCEHLARLAARRMNIPSVAVIDHWVNYAERFVRDAEVVWPDEFWVTDEDALAIAQASFPGARVVQVENWYLRQQLAKIAAVPRPLMPELLYVLEPARSDWGRGHPGEFQALDYFVEKLSLLDLPSTIQIRLRPHPSDPLGKYDDWIRRHPQLNLILDDSPAIFESLGRADWVAGCESFALALALQAGRVVYCTQPPWAPPCRLPQSGLIRLGELDYK
ncbi:hypothetical protein [Herbaspirillum sp. NPDC101397]|uniref:hypothetical protein n=1 Tax=Herbaspirillum sp. NPDC101397 TaxID=3364006 RepID=UPI00383BC1BA